jgi:hypothetical protein
MHVSEMHVCAGLDTLAGVALPNETSSISDVSELRIGHSTTASGRIYASHAAGALGTTVLEMEESGMHDMTVGSKISHLAMSARTGGGSQDEEKQNMDPVLQELKCALLVSTRGLLAGCGLVGVLP